MPKDLESRRRAIVRAFRSSARTADRGDDSADVAALKRRVSTLEQRVAELTRVLDGLASHDFTSLPVSAVPDEEPPAGRVSVPPVTAAKISNQAFDVLLGTVPSRETPAVEAEPRIA